MIGKIMVKTLVENTFQPELLIDILNIEFIHNLR
jgi:hypothetical protein